MEFNCYNFTTSYLLQVQNSSAILGRIESSKYRMCFEYTLGSQKMMFKSLQDSHA